LKTTRVDIHDQIVADNVSIAWWIAFGPHGPRAETPPGEWGRVWFYTAIGVAVSAVLFYSIHAFARPPPRTMTKEWQEATNEYLKVSPGGEVLENVLLTLPRKNESIPSTVSAVKATKAKASYRARPPRPRAFLSSLTTTILSRRIQCGSFLESAIEGFAGRLHGWLYACDAFVSIAASIAYVQKLNLIDCAIMIMQDMSSAVELRKLHKSICCVSSDRLS